MTRVECQKFRSEICRNTTKTFVNDVWTDCGCLRWWELNTNVLAIVSYGKKIKQHTSLFRFITSYAVCFFCNCCYHVTTDNTFVWTLISSPNHVYLQSQNTKWLIVSTNRPFPHILKSLLSPIITVINNVLVNSKLNQSALQTVLLQLIHVPPTDTTPVNSIDVWENHPHSVITRLNITHSLVTFCCCIPGVFQFDDILWKNETDAKSTNKTEHMTRAGHGTA